MAHPFLDAESAELRLNFVHDSIATNGIACVIRKTPAKIRLNKDKLINDLKTLEKGVMVDGVMCKPTRVKIKKNDSDKDYSIVEITITEGRNHIVKRVFKELGYLVDKLSRVSYGFLDVSKMKSGDYRELSIKEVKKLYDYKY